MKTSDVVLSVSGVLMLLLPAKGLVCLFKVSGECYIIPTMKATFNEARKICENMNGTLVQLQDQEVFKKVTDKIATHKEQYWVGLTKDDHAKSFRWDNKAAPEQSNWGPEEPNDSGRCVRLKRIYGSEVLKRHRLADARCLAKYNFICQIRQELVHGGWSDWTEFADDGECSVSCGGGDREQSRDRECNSPTPQHGGRDCQGDRTESKTVPCNIYDCPVHGGWSDWTEFADDGECSVSCGRGDRQQSRDRKCNSPTPQHGGRDCEGNRTEAKTVPCNTHECPVHGGWSDWTEFADDGECSVSCGGGDREQSRGRECNSPTPQHGGWDCEGDRTEAKTVPCNTHECPESRAKEFVGCYGDGSDDSDFFTPSCASPEVIVIDNMYALAKKTSSGCGLAALGVNYDREKCCAYDANDYKTLYKGISLSEYLTACVAKSSCKKPVTRQEVNTMYVEAGYMAFTTYMIMEYSCVHETSVLDPSSNKTASQTTIILQSEGKKVLSDSASCKVAAPCYTSVIVESIHFYTNESHTSLEITDGGNSQTLLCSGNNFTGVTYVSETSSLQITLSNMTEGTWLWAQMKGTNGDVINMSCNADDGSADDTCSAGSAPSLPAEEVGGGSFFTNDVKSVCGNNKLVTTVKPTSTVTSKDPQTDTSTPGTAGPNTTTETHHNTNTTESTGTSPVVSTEHPGRRQSPGYTTITLNSSTGVPGTGASTVANDWWKITVIVVLVVLVFGGVAGYFMKKKMNRSRIFPELLVSDHPLASLEAESVAPVATTLGRQPRRLEPLRGDSSWTSGPAPSDDTVP